MIGRRTVAAGVVMAAVTAGAVAGALVGIPGISGASGSPNVSTAGASGTTTTQPGSDHHRRGFPGMAFGVGAGAGHGVIDAAAKALNLSTPDLLKKLSDGKTTIADVAQQEGVPLKTVTDAMEAVSNSQISDLVTKPFPKFRGTPGDGKGPDNDHHRMGGMGMGFGFGGEIRGSIDSVAKSLGISAKDLMTDLGKGQSIADIAKAKNVPLDPIITNLVTDATAKINDAVTNGHLSKDQAAKIEANLKDMITKVVNNGFKFGGFGGFGHGGHGGHGGPGGFGGPGGPGGFGGFGPSGPTGVTGPAPTA